MLALDPTCLADRLRVPCAAVLDRGTAPPVARAAQSADGTGSRNDVWRDLPGRLKAELGEGRTILVLTDRGPESAELFRAVAAPGWHPLMRAEARGRSRPAGWHKGYAMTDFAPGVGRRWSGAGVAYPSAGVPLACTLLASRDAGHAEPWLVLTDPPARGADAAWSAWRVWTEQGFRASRRGSGSGTGRG